ncbi:hypothetical protein IL306_002980 [Fusarium sp. DS 682]|nr:hypothetical protein IL306_002980 [Fusarium sp. DS 682]
MRENIDHRTKYGSGNPFQTSLRKDSLAASIAPPATAENILPRESGSSKPKKSKKSGSKSDPVDENIVKGVERLLKLHYLRSRDYNTAMEILYGNNSPSNKELNFDLSGPGEVLTQKGLENLTGKIGFEDTLQYVCIPKITVEEPSSKEKTRVPRPTKPLSDGAGRSDLVHIFGKLREKHVETILRVIVDDSEYPSHSDEAIEKALKGMGVEVWKWNKPDLCTEVILNAAPKAREVHLSWSGNNAVLGGWSEAGGLPTLPALKVIHLHPQQGLESVLRMKRNINESENRMKRLCPNVKVVRPDRPDNRKRRNGKITTRVEETKEHGIRHEWIECMRSFRTLLFDAERSCPKINENIEQIKVAIIDDGVDMKDLYQHQFIGGKSFCIRSEDEGLIDSYYSSRTGHGTIMAKNIHFMCPEARFFVLRLKDCQSEDETRLNITARSAAKAICEAIRQKVQTISMAWTIDPPKDEKERRDLDSAVVEAANANILMFCSARDKGADSALTYPSKATTKIFTIGAANSSGASLDYVGNPTKLSYTFPGHKVKVDDGPNPSKTTPQTADGSSVATSLAAGLAALILYCVQVRIFLAKDSEKQRAREDYRKVKQHDGMEKAFGTIDTTQQSGHTFLKVWEVFGRQVEQRDQRPNETLELVVEVGPRLCGRIY